MYTASFARILVFILIINAFSLAAHGDLHEQIQQKTIEITKDPQNAQLYFERGELYRQHSESLKAVTDYKKGLQIDPDYIYFELGLSRAFYDLKDINSGLIHIQKFLNRNQNHVMGLRVRADFYILDNRPELAVEDYIKVLNIADNPFPKNYKDVSNAYMLMDHSNYRLANEWLDSGLKLLGPVITLQQMAIENSLLAKDYQNALERTDWIIGILDRKEEWHFKKAKICESAGDPDQAMINYKACASAIYQLPFRIRQKSATKKLIIRTDQALARLAIK